MKKSWLMCSALVAVYLTIAPNVWAINQASPQTKPWTDHSKQLDMFVDAADQVFSYAWLKVIRDKTVRIDFRCEHNSPGASSAVYTIKFKKKDKELDAISVQCDLGGAQQTFVYDIPLYKSGGARGFPFIEIDLSSVLDEIDTVQLYGSTQTSNLQYAVCVRWEQAKCVMFKPKVDPK